MSKKNTSVGTTTDSKFLKTKIKKFWYVDDIVECAQKYYPDDWMFITKEQFLRVKQILENTHDSNVGINWEVIENAICTMLEEEDAKYVAKLPPTPAEVEYKKRRSKAINKVFETL